jgi:hypothetical protein
MCVCVCVGGGTVCPSHSHFLYLSCNRPPLSLPPPPFIPSLSKSNVIVHIHMFSRCYCGCREMLNQIPLSLSHLSIHICVGRRWDVTDSWAAVPGKTTVVCVPAMVLLVGWSGARRCLTSHRKNVGTQQARQCLKKSTLPSLS